MSGKWLCFERKNYKWIGLGRLICSFILIITIVLCSESIYAQDGQGLVSSDNNNVIPQISKAVVSLSDVDGDNLNDASFENKNIRLVISSKTGTISFYYLKGKKFEENIYPPEIKNYGYIIEDNFQKVFSFDNLQNSFSKTSYNIEIDSKNDSEVIVRATANVSLNVDDKTPDDKSVGLIRRFILPNEGYAIKIENIITNLKEKLITLGDDEKGSFSMSYGPGIFMQPYGPTSVIGLKPAGESDIFTNYKTLNEKGYKLGFYNGVGIKDQYFCVLMEAEQQLRISVLSNTISSNNKNKRDMEGKLLICTLPKFNLGAKETRTITYQIYAGPIIPDELQKINRVKVADFGWLVSRMLELLRFFYSKIPNYGVAIILLTLLVRLILYPLTLKQTQEMAKMQKLQPKLKDLQDRYKDNPQKLNEEVLKLYTKNKVNPLGGCFPVLLQLPIIMALFNTFRNAVELRKASFLWMNDLSKGDPYLILPIAIAALMFYQQGKTNVDPQQRQAMAIMPVMMLVITFSLPSGLLVYWFASSVLGILQQLQANRYTASIKEE